MNPLETRLREIAAELGEHHPANTYFQDLLGLSSGRITQLFEIGGTSKLGAKSLSRLVAKGYNPDWVQEGPPHKKTHSRNAEQSPAVTDSLTAEIHAYIAKMDTVTKARLLTDLAQAPPVAVPPKKPKHINAA